MPVYARILQHATVAGGQSLDVRAARNPLDMQKMQER